MIKRRGRRKTAGRFGSEYGKDDGALWKRKSTHQEAQGTAEQPTCAISNSTFFLFTPLLHQEHPHHSGIHGKKKENVSFKHRRKRRNTRTRSLHRTRIDVTPATTTREALKETEKDEY